MAKSLKLTIELAGAEEIKRQLEGVGEAGEAAFDKILTKAKEVGGFNKLDPGVVTQSIEELGVKGPAAIGKITAAVKSAGKMETLINALTGVENGLAGIQAAASAMDQVLLKGLTRSIGIVARLLPAAFAASTVGAIVSTTKAIRELDAAAIKAGVSIEDMSKARGIFEAIGLSAKSAAEAVDTFDKNAASMVKDAIAQMDKFNADVKDGVDLLAILERASKRPDATGDAARKKLQERGRLDVSKTAEEIDKIRQSAASVPEQILAIIAKLQTMRDTTERNRIAAQLFGTEFVQALNAGGVALDQATQKQITAAAKTQAHADAASRLALEWEKLKVASGFDFKFDISPEALDAIAASLGQIRSAIEWIAATFKPALDIGGNTQRELIAIGAALTQIGNLGVSIWSGIKQAAIDTWQTIIGWIDTAIQKVKEFFSSGGGKAAQIPDAGGFARGGIMGGRGSGTSDSNLAWLSRGEHIMPAYAVRQPGVLQLLEALRRSGGNLRGVLDRMGHFALGGMVSAPAFATGGAVGGMSNVTIQFPGVQPITGLRASSVVVDELRRSAALAQVRAGGRKPSRYT